MLIYDGAFLFIVFMVGFCICLDGSVIKSYSSWP